MDSTNTAATDITGTKRAFQNRCQVCELEVSKYRCPKCKTLYCSIPCKNSHNCQELGPSKPEDQHLVKEGNDTIVTEDDHRVPRRLLERIRDSESLVSKLKSDRLREIISNIDGSDTKLKDLNHEMQYNKDFHDFIYEMLRETGYVDAHGQFIEKER